MARRNWQGSQQCCFCHEDETIQHLFFDCHVTRLVWASVYAAWGLPKPSSVSNMFGNWLNGIPKHYKPLVLVGAAALCWSVWRSRNAVVFDNKKLLSCRLSSRLHFGYEHGLSYNGHLHMTPLWRRRIFWPRWPRTFLPGRMGGSLGLGLTAISVLGFIDSFQNFL